MAAPVTPQDFKDTIPEANAKLCPKLIKVLVKLPVLIWKLVNYMFKSDGTVSDTFKADIGLTVGGLAAPTNVAATDGTYTNKVTVTWSSVSGASSYTVWRNTVDDSAAATQIGSPATTSFDDNSVIQGTVYYYWVKAVNAAGSSAFSGSNSGYSSSGVTQTLEFSNTQDWIVPTGVTSVALKLWGAGGGGGGAYSPFAIAPTYGGGGAGGGEYRYVTAITVAAGQTLNLNIGTGGGAGSVMSTGQKGKDTFINRSGSQLAIVFGGNGGNPGNGTPPGTSGTGGTGGSGGSNAVGTLNTATGGATGNAGGAAGLGGTGGGAVGSPASYGSGGNGAYIGGANSTNGADGHITIILGG